jgi:hypothetical protein
MRFDFEVDQEDEYMCQWIAKAHLKGITTAVATDGSDLKQMESTI